MYLGIHPWDSTIRQNPRLRLILGEILVSLRELCFDAELLATSVYNKPQGILPEANSGSVTLRTSAVKSSRWSSYRTSLRAFPEAELTFDSIRNFEDFGSEVLKVWVVFLEVGLQDKPQGHFPEADKIRPAGVVICCVAVAAAQLVTQVLFYCAAAAAAQ
ncbi:hypothetical protein BY996DRAFT_6420306 [Phakopsora pachyrhizi]|nr:hypothetical protein BY996DRAFT_6420306 [Phakopsora pachyrhizi]